MNHPSLIVEPRGTSAVNNLCRGAAKTLSQSFFVATRSAFMTDSYGSLSIIGLDASQSKRLPKINYRQQISLERVPTAVCVASEDENGSPREVVYGDRCGNLTRINLERGVARSILCHESTVSFCSRNDVNDWIASGSWDNSISISLSGEQESKLISRWDTPSNSVRVLCGQWAPVCITPNAFISGSHCENNRGNLLLYDVRSCSKPMIAIDHFSSIFSTCWPASNGGHILLGGDQLGTLLQWDIRQPGKPILSLSKYHGRGNSHSALRVGCSISSISHNSFDGNILSSGTDRMFRYADGAEFSNRAGMKNSQEFTTGIQPVRENLAIGSSLDGSIEVFFTD
eukprot:GHVH01012934.1.p1 GENE.GHVH01012934.1~~GHVH01012934.1.p1  ORF type:complete len:342 (+),score=22.48 GHVH01012934.1:380-1405(+)